MSVSDYYRRFLETNPNPRKLRSLSDELNFSTNDYLGLAKHPLLVKRAQDFAELYGVGGTSSRSVVGNHEIYSKLEAKLAQALGKPAALILGSGYQANVSVLDALLDPAVLGEPPLVFCDRLCHVSLLMGCRMHARIHRFAHNDLEHLQRLLERYAKNNSPKFVLVESLYSMDGDWVDLSRLTTLVREYDAFLYVDDAHAVGVYGKNGWGIASDFSDNIDLVMGTFSKALGSYGAYIACSMECRDYLVNKCKGLIYSTALPLPILGAIDAALELIPQLSLERKKLLSHAKQIRDFFAEQGLDYGSSKSHIIPWVIGDSLKTLKAAELLRDEGILGAPIRPPSVQSGKSRIRFCLSANHTEAQLDQLKSALQKVERKL